MIASLRSQILRIASIRQVESSNDAVSGLPRICYADSRNDDSMRKSRVIARFTLVESKQSTGFKRNFGFALFYERSEATIQRTRI